MPSAARSSKPMPGSIAPRLLDWFAGAARDLPWRRTTDPYAIWVSEVMLQQTQVRTVIGYWERWMAELPDLQSLANAPTDSVLKLWEGLGYYSRARNLQRAARQIVAEHQGVFPRDPDRILALPGIGRYTAGAIASSAFNLPTPILDGNVMRVLTRLGAIPGDPRQRETNAVLWKEALELVVAAAALAPTRVRPPARPIRLAGPCSQLNQALMELGATVCKPANPDCANCPVSSSCQAFALGSPEDFPQKAARPVVTPRILATVIWNHRRRWLLHRRSDDSVNGGFWEFPNIECGPVADPLSSLARWLGIGSDRLEPLGQIRHSITRYRFIQHLYCLTGDEVITPPGGEVRWVTRSELDSLPLTGAHRRLVARYLTS
jgi:A/G-specific adenine glycosylase